MWNIDSKDKALRETLAKQVHTHINHLSLQRSSCKLARSLGAINYMMECIAGGVYCSQHARWCGVRLMAAFI